LSAEDSLQNLTEKIPLFAGFSGGGLFFILDGLVSRVFLAPERLVYRNFCGAKKGFPGGISTGLASASPTTAASGNISW